MELNILDMYSDTLNIYGDIGNLISIKKRCEWRGIEVNQESFSVGQENNLDYENVDMVLIGGGSDKSQAAVSNDLLKQRNDLENYIENDGVLLAICGSYQMFGNKYSSFNENSIPCLEIFDMETIAQEERLTGNILIENSLGLRPRTLVGFENHGGRTYHKYDVLGNVEVGYGNNDESKEEGLSYKNFIGTYLHGAFLPKNPHMADHLILNALKNKYDIDSLEPLNDDIELQAHDFMANKLLKSKK
ncbi:type 1 glutamine amidotransferase [Methanobrevibacter sp. DSM 116169]|uniref:type 1 glutamine amidotransferase n=1 Tax=Methanobrevibacter sp. DSM 116169 TaxID=3242727 RepID=UPI0038FC028D